MLLAAVQRIQIVVSVLWQQRNKKMVLPTDVNWKRFWCPREGSYQLSGNGYLYDYESQPTYGNPNIVTLDDLLDMPCLILLGEPGIGKSTEIRKHFKFIEEKARFSGDEFLRFDLQNYTTDQRLFDQIFQNPTFKKWAKGKNRLYLFLDSLDEALLNINTLSTALPYELNQFPIERLYFRIVSRTAEWPGNLESEIKSIWGENNVLAFELLPLRKRDIEEYVTSKGVNSDAFIKIIESRDGQPFAIKPVTLSFLTQIYIQQGDIPQSKKELYLEGCRLLCEESNEDRKVSNRAGKLTPEQRMKIAARIAALSIFANKAAIRKDTKREGYLESDLSKESVLGGVESADRNDFIVGPSEINEALNTGLFSAMGSGRLGWSHRTYAEFLAAWYVTDHNFESSKMLSIITHPGDMKQRLIPQLHETAAWLATFSPEIFSLLLDREPEVLLRSDVLATEPAVRSSLLQALLTAFESGKLFEPMWGDYYHYKKLKHPDIGNQLRDYIFDKKKNFRTRRLAIDIAEECACVDLQDDLANTALDSEEIIQLREQAAHAVVKIADKTTKLKLKPLASGIAGDDPNDELKACGLYAIWPDCISANELFELITPQKKDNYLGQYWEFLEMSVARNLKLQDIPIALDWVTKSTNIAGYANPYENLVDQIMLLGWDNINQPGILRPFAQAVLSRISNYHDIFSRSYTSRLKGNPQPVEIVEKENDKRHALVLEILAISSQSSFDLSYLMFYRTPLIFRKDFDWLIDTYARLEDNIQKTAIAEWVSRICDVNSSEQIEFLYKLYESDSIFKKLFSGWFDPVELGSERATKLKELYLATRTEEEPHPKLSPPLIERVKGRLEKNEQGDAASWWILNREMTIDETKLMYGDEFEQDITELPGWKISDNGIRERIIEAAKRYVLEGEPKNQEWIGRNIIFRPAMAGYRAIRLIFREGPEYISELDPLIWQKWAAIILAYPMRSSEKADLLDDGLVKIAYICASSEIEKTLAFLIRKENQKDGVLDAILNRINSIWDEKLEGLLLRRIKSGNLKPNLFRTILGFLLSHHSRPTQEYVIRKLKSYRPGSTKDKNDIAVATQLLLINSEEINWEIIWTAMMSDEKLSENVIKGLAWQRGEVKLFNSLSFIQLADLYSYLVLRYPPAEDRVGQDLGGNEFREISIREEIGNWRDSIISFMVNSGAPEACVALRGLAALLPQYEYIKRRLLDAEANMRQKTWNPLCESDLLTLFLDSETKLIESGQNLLEVIIQSLDNLNISLQGETPAAIFLWNELGNKKNRKYRPKDENRLSDYVKLHLERELQQKGIIVNREVEIRHGDGSQGERTDIHVDAVRKHPIQDGYDKITVIIEAKGCWHSELEIAMKAQLLDRYLKENICRFGLYLIGWFQCSQWDPKDRRYKKTPQYSMDEANIKFGNQAVALSTEDILLKSYILDVTL